MLKIGVIATSLKENERRVPIHPEHLDLIPESLRRHLVFEEGYGLPFGVDDSTIALQSGGTASRDQLLKRCDVVLIAKPVVADLLKIREEGIIWGWLHFVQQRELTQVAIERRLTAIAWEAMHHWGPEGEFRGHVFSTNSEIAGYAGVLDALRQLGITGRYGPPRRAVVIGFGAVGHGAVYALRSQDFRDLLVLVTDSGQLAQGLIPDVSYRELELMDGRCLGTADPDRGIRPLIDELAAADIIVNGICQDPNRPLMFIQEDDVERLKPGCLIIDISCDRGMGFPFAQPTTFENPIIKLGNISYYAVDHTPSYLWNSASWEISRSIIPFLPKVMAGPQQWQECETIRRAIEIQAGYIRNSSILAFQGRSPQYPHPPAAFSCGERELVK